MIALDCRYISDQTYHNFNLYFCQILNHYHLSKLTSLSSHIHNLATILAYLRKCYFLVTSWFKNSFCKMFIMHKTSQLYITTRNVGRNEVYIISLSNEPWSKSQFRHNLLSSKSFTYCAACCLPTLSKKLSCSLSKFYFVAKPLKNVSRGVGDTFL